MMVISSPQYVWTLFTQPLMATVGAGLAQIQITFSILIVIQTFLAPCQGLLVDRFGPRVLLSVGGALTGLSWLLAARATTLVGLYLTYGALGGIGTGIVYVGVIGHMVRRRWFAMDCSLSPSASSRLRDLDQQIPMPKSQAPNPKPNPESRIPNRGTSVRRTCCRHQSSG